MLRTTSTFFRRTVCAPLACVLLCIATSQALWAQIRIGDALAEPAADSTSELYVLVSTPGDYLYGHRDDFDDVWQGFVYSETGFSLSTTDFEKLQIRNTAKTDVGVKPIAETYGLKIGMNHRVARFNIGGNSEDDGVLQLSYGGRYTQLNSRMWFDAYGSILGHIHMDTQTDNDFVGPQVALNWSDSAFGIEFDVDTSFMVGYNLLTTNHLRSFSPDIPALSVAAPGSPNGPILARPVLTVIEEDRSETAHVGEIRASARYPITRHVALRLSYSGLYLSGMQRADRIHLWSLPTPSTLAGATSNHWLDQIHASIEWRR